MTIATSTTVAHRTLKCVVWDLDNTIWSGVLLEDAAVALKTDIPEVLRTLDERGILHSIASRNDPEPALARLTAFGLRDYFLYPTIGWGAKSHAVREIAARLNIALDAVAFVDDDPVERSEVSLALPDVRCYDAREAGLFPLLPDFTPAIITADARQRRHMYRADVERQAAEAAFDGPPDAFLSTLAMRLRIAPAEPEDLARAEELVIRTNQLNSTGRTYSQPELAALTRSADHLLFVASLDDRFGSYGSIGLVLLDREPSRWTIRLLLVSCRVLSRGIGMMVIGYVQRLARQAGVRLQAAFVDTGRNRMMYMTFKLAGFVEIERHGGQSIFEHDLSRLHPLPDFVEMDLTPPIPRQ